MYLKYIQVFEEYQRDQAHQYPGHAIEGGVDEHTLFAHSVEQAVNSFRSDFMQFLTTEFEEGRRDTFGRPVPQADR